MHLTPLPKSDASLKSFLEVLCNPVILFTLFFMLFLGLAQMERDDKKAEQKKEKQSQASPTPRSVP